MGLSPDQSLSTFSGELSSALFPTKSGNSALEINTAAGIVRGKSPYIDPELLIKLYGSPLDMDDELDLEYSLSIAKLLHNNKLKDEYFPRLISGMILHFCDARASFVDRVCVLAAIFLKKDDFDIKGRRCYGLFTEYLPGELRRQVPPNSRRTVYERCGTVVNNHKTDGSKTQPVYIQQAIKILRNKEDLAAMRKVYDNFEGILAKTTRQALKYHGTALFKLLLDLGTPDLYDVQFRSLAYFISLNFDFYDDALNIFYESKLEILQFYLITSLNALHDLVAPEQRVILHVKFTEAFISHNKVFEPPVQKEIECFVTKGIMMLGLERPYYNVDA